MKTAEQFLEECKAKWTLNTPESSKQAMIEALIMYAEQAIVYGLVKLELRVQ